MSLRDRLHARRLPSPSPERRIDGASVLGQLSRIAIVLMRSNADAKAPALKSTYWAKPTVPSCVLTTGGGFHFPVSASDFGL
ncbi:hypothetical protein ACVWWO_007083 [Bradyrhizobium sp. F1.13.1]